MQKALLSLAALLAAISGFAQGGNTRDGGPDGNYRSVYELVSNQQKKNDGFNLYLNFAGAFVENFNPQSSLFRARDLRLEIKGSFGDHLSYRLRHRLNRAWWSDGQADNFSKATDIMMLGWKFNDHWQINLGKMCQIWGGFEYDENPMFIYQYSDLVDNMDIFMTGAMVSWHPVPSQELAVMVTNSHTTQPQYRGYELSAHPLTYILNWNASFGGGILQLRWAGGAQTEAKGQYSFMATLGQKLSLRKFQVYVDYMGEFDQLDRLGIVYRDLGIQSGVQYHSIIGKADWQFAPRWNLMGKGMYEIATVSGNPMLRNYRRSIGWVGCLEFYPWDQQNLRFFLAYIGRNHNFTRASGAAANNGTFHRLELGFMYRIKAY